MNRFRLGCLITIFIGMAMMVLMMWPALRISARVDYEDVRPGENHLELRVVPGRQILGLEVVDARAEGTTTGTYWGTIQCGDESFPINKKDLVAGRKQMISFNASRRKVTVDIFYDQSVEAGVRLFVRPRK